MIQIKSRKNRPQGDRLSLALLQAGSCVLLGALAFSPACAYADVRNDDLVAGKSIEERALDKKSCPDITAEHAYVIDSNGNVLYQRNDEATAKIASITKIMTAIVALENAPEDLVITVSESAADIGESNAGLEAGDSMSLYEALKALMISSGNDAAQAIAESVGGSMLGNWDDPAAGAQAFVDAMNAKAEELGMANTLFTNPHGLDDEGYESDQHSTASDVAVMCSTAMEDDMFRDIVSNSDITCTVNRNGENETIELKPTDELIGQYEGTCGIKTGFTDTAGGCFAGACNRNGQDLYAIVLASDDEETRFEDTRALWDWAYGNTVSLALASSDETTVDQESGEEVPLVAKVSCTSWIDKTVDATLADPAQAIDVFALKGDVTQEAEFDLLEGKVEAGSKVGQVTYTQDGETIATVDLVATQTVEEPKWYEKALIWLKRLYLGLVGEPIQAESEFLLEETRSPLTDGNDDSKKAEPEADKESGKGKDSKQDSDENAQTDKDAKASESEEIDDSASTTEEQPADSEGESSSENA